MCAGLMCGRGHYCACCGPGVFSGGGANFDMMRSESVEAVTANTQKIALGAPVCNITGARGCTGRIWLRASVALLAQL